MSTWFFASDLHGHVDRYRALLETAARERPAAILLGGDLLPSGLAALTGGTPVQPPRPIPTGETPVPQPPPVGDDFISDVVAPGFAALRDHLGHDYPQVYLILGNDDGRADEATLLDVEGSGLWTYLHDRRADCHGVPVVGYSFVPPTPFLLKDWERYDVSRFTDPGCVSPEEGWRTVPVDATEVRYATIADDLARLAGTADQGGAVWLFHAPPYQTALDRAALDGMMVDHAPLDVHVGSIAIRRFIEARQPRVTLHGHVHESARLTGAWQDRLGTTVALSAAHDGPELALVRFDPAVPASATRDLIG